MLDPDSVFVLPYHEYLKWVYEENGIDTNEKWKKLSEIAIPIEEGNLIPHFKYVSMHLSHDKCIYLLYAIRKSVEKMKEHKIIDYTELKEIERRLDKLLAIAWREKGQYPGFKNALQIILKDDFRKDQLKELIPKIEDHILKNFDSLDNFWESSASSTRGEQASSDVARAIGIISKKKELLKFLSMFDFSIKQFEHALEIVNKIGLPSVKNNPYILLEKYQYDISDQLNIDDSDYGLSLYQIDIALIPDPTYANWSAAYNAQSPERLRAVIAKILYDAAFQAGNSCLSRDEIVKYVEEYPLYYITNELKLNISKLLEYEKEATFKDKFVIKETIVNEYAVYQLRIMREIENIIEQFITRMLKKVYELNEKDSKDVKAIVENEYEALKDKLDVDERNKLYENVLQNGVFLLSGKAGSGKTSAIVNLIRKFKSDGNIPIFVFTPTGKANLVIRDRLREFGLHKDPHIRISTIHRFLYTALFDYIRIVSSQIRSSIFRMRDLIEKILDGKLELLDEFKSLARQLQLRPRVVIIDEASMVDELLLATLFCLINVDNLKYLIIVGDEKQLPPIGVGRPFVDTIFHLKRNNLEKNYIRLESNLRFDPSAKIGILSELFSGDKAPFPTEIEATLSEADDTLELCYFTDVYELKNAIKNVLHQIGKPESSESISEMFADIFENGGTLSLDKIQIISPRRVGDFGSWAINVNVIRDGNADFSTRTKLICEKNMYIDARDKGKYKRILGLANGSIGYIGPDWDIYFEDMADLRDEYEWVNVWPIINEISGDFAVLRTERDIDFGYAITVHKAQGSDFDYVMLVLPETSPFIMKELLYTAFTRPKSKLYFMVHNNLKEELALVLSKAYENSSVEQRKTLLFEYKLSPFKPYLLTLKDGRALEVKSKIERIVAKALDDNTIDFEYEPREFFEEFHVVPDFKLLVNGNTYYIEHLGNMSNPSYRNRWLQKFEIYKKLGISDILITTSESEEPSNIEENIKQIIEDIKSGNIRETEGGYSQHHYYV